MELKTSLEWIKEINDGVEIIDPAGWNKEHFVYSFLEEKITKEEFLERRQKSTCIEQGRGD